MEDFTDFFLQKVAQVNLATAGVKHGRAQTVCLGDEATVNSCACRLLSVHPVGPEI